ncbi:hypothetical protein L6Q96_07480 [Candidatus Binatia bacterium]|nr:hypothetical protein [Candidatus Binatia bacterium]
MRGAPRRQRRYWLAVVVVAGALAGCEAPLPEPESAGARLYADRCRGCHRLYAPGSMTAEMWRVQVERMHGDMVRRGVEPLSPAETTLLLDYLRRHSQ